jgi:branched-chain amino acid transport system permease protein
VYFVHIGHIVFLYAALATALSVIADRLGLPLLCQAAPFGVGAYIAALATTDAGLPIWAGVLAAALGGWVFGLAIGRTLARLRDDYFAIATLVLGVLAFHVANNAVSLTHGPLGIAGVPVVNQPGSSWISLVLSVACLAGAVALARSSARGLRGATLGAIRDDEVFAQSCGVNTTLKKTEAIGLSSAVAGVSGAVYVHYIGFIDPSCLSAADSIAILAMVIIGRPFGIWAGLMGALAYVLFGELAALIGIAEGNVAYVRQMLFGVCLVMSASSDATSTARAGGGAA